MNANTAARTIAIAAASLWHAGQKYGEADYTEAHLLPVAKAAELLYFSAEEDGSTDLYVVGLFHDAVEDGKASEEDVVSLLLPVVGGFRASRIGRAVSTLARDPSMTYGEYVRTLIEAPKEIRHTVLLVKLADLKANMAAGAKGSASLMNRYGRAHDEIAYVLNKQN